MSFPFLYHLTHCENCKKGFGQYDGDYRSMRSRCIKSNIKIREIIRLKADKNSKNPHWRPKSINFQAE